MRKLANYRVVAGDLSARGVALAALIYGRGIDNHFVADDWVFLLQVSRVHTPADIAGFFTFNTGWFVRPTQWITTWAVYQVAAMNPMPYHLVGIALEFVSALLLGLLTYRLLKVYEPTSDRHPLAAIAVALLFVFSWRHHEAVFWYSSINELLASSFRLSALVLVACATTGQGTRTNAVLMSLAALGACFLAILSKESSIVLPLEIALLLLCDYLAQGHKKAVLTRHAILLIPFVVLTSLWAAFYLQTSAGTSVSSVERSGLTVLHTSALNVTLRFLQFFNGNFIGTGFISQSIPLMLVELFALVALAIVALMRKRYLWLFALLWTVAAIAPYVGMTSTEAIELQIPVLMLGVAGDRFLHYSAAGASLLIVMSVLWLVGEFRRLAPHGAWCALLKGAIGAALLAFMSLNAHRLVQLEADWDNAGRIGHGIVQQIQELVPNPSAGSVLCIGNVPDNYRGKYIFRNGISQALYLAYAKGDFAIRSMVQLPHTLRSPPELDETDCSNVIYYDGHVMVVKAQHRP